MTNLVNAFWSYLTARGLVCTGLMTAQVGLADVPTD